MRRSVSVAVLITVVVLGGAVWGARNSAVAAQGKTQNAEVKIDNFSFGPAMVTIPAGSTVTLGVSIGFKMPDVKGQQVAAAGAQLTALGFNVTVEKKTDQSVVGTVIDQKPSSGDFVSAGDAAGLLVSQDLRAVTGTAEVKL